MAHKKWQPEIGRAVIVLVSWTKIMGDWSQRFQFEGDKDMMANVRRRGARSRVGGITLRLDEGTIGGTVIILG